MATTDQVWAVVEAGTIVNVTVGSAGVAAARGYLGPITALKPQPGIGWTTPDNGATWAAPSDPTED